MEEEYIYLVFSKTSTWLSKLIGHFINSKYTHVTLSLDNNFNKMYTFSRVNPNNPFSGGLTIEDLSCGVYTKSKSTYCSIYKIKITKKQFEEVKIQLNKYYTSNIKYKYNFIGLFGVLFNKPIKRNRHMFCSQFVSNILINSNIHKFNKVPELIKPCDLLELESKELIYDGLLYNYNLNNLNILTQTNFLKRVI